MRDFMLSELYGPVPCEHPGCTDKDAFTIRLTDEENNQLPKKSGSAAVIFIFKNKLGTALCDNHLK